jgi:hypothetical protein
MVFAHGKNKNKSKKRQKWNSKIFPEQKLYAPWDQAQAQKK